MENEPTDASLTEAAPGWDTLSYEDKTVYLTQMILECSQKLRLKEPEPIIAILVPPGAKEEFEPAWKEAMLASLQDKTVGEESHPHHAYFFPPVQEAEVTRVPVLYSAIDQERALLSHYFQRLVTNSGVDTSSLFPVTTNLDVLRAVYLVAEILLPSLIQIEPKKKSNIIIP